MSLEPRPRPADRRARTPHAFRPLALAALAAVAAPAAGAPAASERVIVAYDFDAGSGDTVANRAGKEQAGRITGATWVEGHEGTALRFQGPDDSGPYRPPGSYLAVAGSEGLNPRGRVRVDAWIRPAANPLAWGGIVEKGVGYGSSWRLVMLRSGRLRATVGNDHVSVDSPDPIPLDAWTRVGMAWDGKLLRLLVGEAPVAEAPAAPSGLASDAPIEIGRRFTGAIDDVEVRY